MKFIIILLGLLLLLGTAFAIPICEKIFGACLSRHCEDNLIIIGKGAGTEEKPKCIYSIEEECMPPLICEHAQCVEPVFSSLQVTKPKNEDMFPRKETIIVEFAVQNPPEGSHVDISVDNMTHHVVSSPFSLGALGSGAHTIVVTVMSRGHYVMQNLEKTISFKVSPAATLSPTIYAENIPKVRDAEIEIPFKVYNMPDFLHVDILLNGELLRHNITSPFKVHLQPGKNNVVLQLAQKNEKLDSTKRALQIEYIPDLCKNVKCLSPLNLCYNSHGICSEGKCTYSFLSKGSICSLTKICDGNGNCSIDRQKSAYSSYIANPFSTEKKGNLFIALEKNKKGIWREAFSLDPTRITIHPFSYFDLAAFWNKKADFNLTEPGEYRFFVQLDTLRTYKEFSVT